MQIREAVDARVCSAGVRGVERQVAFAQRHDRLVGYGRQEFAKAPDAAAIAMIVRRTPSGERRAQPPRRDRQQRAQQPDMLALGLGISLSHRHRVALVRILQSGVGAEPFVGLGPECCLFGTLIEVHGGSLLYEIARGLGGAEEVLEDLAGCVVGQLGHELDVCRHFEPGQGQRAPLLDVGFAE